MAAHDEEDFMAELKQEFKAAVKKNMLEFQSLYKEENYADIARIAHDIKGNAALFALNKGSEIAAELQLSAQNKEAEKVKSLIEALTAYMKEAGISD